MTSTRDSATDESVLAHVLDKVLLAKDDSAYHQALEALGVVGIAHLMRVKEKHLDQLCDRGVLKPVQADVLLLLRSWFRDSCAAREPNNVVEAHCRWLGLTETKFNLYTMTGVYVEDVPPPPTSAPEPSPSPAAVTLDYEFPEEPTFESFESIVSLESLLPTIVESELESGSSELSDFTTESAAEQSPRASDPSSVPSHVLLEVPSAVSLGGEPHKQHELVIMPIITASEPSSEVSVGGVVEATSEADNLLEPSSLQTESGEPSPLLTEVPTTNAPESPLFPELSQLLEDVESKLDAFLASIIPPKGEPSTSLNAGGPTVEFSDPLDFEQVFAEVDSFLASLSAPTISVEPPTVPIVVSSSMPIGGEQYKRHEFPSKPVTEPTDTEPEPPVSAPVAVDESLSTITRLHYLLKGEMPTVPRFVKTEAPPSSFSPDPSKGQTSTKSTTVPIEAIPTKLSRYKQVVHVFTPKSPPTPSVVDFPVLPWTVSKKFLPTVAPVPPWHPPWLCCTSSRTVSFLNAQVQVPVGPHFSR